MHWIFAGCLPWTSFYTQLRKMLVAVKVDGDNSGGMNCQIVLRRFILFSVALFIKATWTSWRCWLTMVQKSHVRTRRAIRPCTPLPPTDRSMLSSIFWIWGWRWAMIQALSHSAFVGFLLFWNPVCLLIQVGEKPSFLSILFFWAYMGNWWRAIRANAK